jgi:exodeoxyribonuclease VII large subunit
MVSYTLFELNEYIKRVIALNFQESVWIECELSQVKESRGNYYLEFVQKKEDTDEIIAQSSGYIWFKSVLFLKKKLGDLFNALLKDGTAVKIKVTIEFHERYGLKLNVEDIDPSFTIGQLEMLRQKIIQKLRDEGKTEANKRLSLPRVVQRIAVISSENAAGYIDFITQLRQNIYGYDFSATLFQSALQGSNTEREVVSALETIFSQKEKFDVIVIIRGGGSKLDLAGFDNYNIASAIARSPLPVLAGIGHEIDVTVTDIVSHFHAKTPTAVAAYIIDRNADFEASLTEKGSQIWQSVQNILQGQHLTLQQFVTNIAVLPGEIIQRQTMALSHTLDRISWVLDNQIRNQKEGLAFAERQIKLLDPKLILQKGFAMVTLGGKPVISKNGIQAETVYTLTFSDGNVNIQKVKDGKK